MMHDKYRWQAALAVVGTLAAAGSWAIDSAYAKKLERSGCTQANELQGCDINKTKAENAQAGFGTAPAAPAGSPSEVAKGACLFKIGVEADIVQTSALKPGNWELIMQAKKGGRKVACTVDDGGKIGDWVEMRAASRPAR